MTHDIPYGTSEPQDFALLDEGSPLVGTGLTVDLVITRANGTSVGSPVPTVAWLDQALGTVRVSGVEGLALGSYRVRYQLTDGGGSVGFSPNGAVADTWNVVRVTT
jgi:hypothetical protein